MGDSLTGRHRAVPIASLRQGSPTEIDAGSFVVSRCRRWFCTAKRTLVARLQTAASKTRSFPAPTDHHFETGTRYAPGNSAEYSRHDYEAPTRASVERRYQERIPCVQNSL
jgi:hypothetical protein